MVGIDFPAPESNRFCVLVLFVCFLLREIVPFENVISFEIWSSGYPWKLYTS